jgi:kelch-like protein 10
MEVGADNGTLQKDAKRIQTHVRPSAMEFFNESRKNNGLLCDAVLRLEDGGSFPVHRVILMANSLYFMTLFTTTIHSEDKTDVLLAGVTSETMRSILDYIYVRSVDIRQENVCQLLVSADYLCVEELVELCCDFFRNMLDVENCIGIMRFAKAYFCSRLERDARCFVMRNFVEVSAHSEELLELSPEELLDVIAADELNVKDEEVVWECIVRWLDYDTHNRKSNVLELFKKLRLGLFDIYFLQETVKCHPYVMENRECSAIVSVTLMLIDDWEQGTMKIMDKSLPDFTRPRIPYDAIVALGGWAEGCMNYIETYDARADRWIMEDGMDSKISRAFHGTAVIGFKIYLLGGTNQTDTLNSCACFDVVTRTWREVAPMYTRRCYLSVAVLDELVYALGGSDGTEILNTAERYEYKTNQWSMIAPMIVRRYHAGAAALNGRLYVAGGCNGVVEYDSAEVYDPGINQWTLIKGMQSRRCGLSCVAYHGCLYAIGGFNGEFCLCSAEKYNPTTDTWDQIHGMYQPRAYFNSVVMDDMIFAIGGSSESGMLKDVYCYEETSNEWFSAGKMNKCVVGRSACVVTSLPNVCDYIHRQKVTVTEKQRQKLLAEEREANGMEQ